MDKRQYCLDDAPDNYSGDEAMAYVNGANFGYECGKLDHNDEITSFRAELEKAKKDGWISVDTALPELRDDSVLAHFANGSIETIHIEDYFRQITDGFDSNGNQKYTRWYLHSTPLVTHWQPLPEPPKE